MCTVLVNSTQQIICISRTENDWLVLNFQLYYYYLCDRRPPQKIYLKNDDMHRLL